MVEGTGFSARLADGTSLYDLVDEKRGRISRRIYADPEVFELEQERLFRRTWSFLAHESELPEPGDVLTRDLAGEPVLLVRGDDGKVRAFLNSCRHRGMRVCRTDRAKVKRFTCPYHGWTYSRAGALIAVFAEDLYDDAHLNKAELGLVPVAQLGSYRGLIFGTWSGDVPPLETFLGNMKFYLDLYLGRSDAGTEVVGVPQVWDVDANWKFAADNFTGDNFHIYSAHGSIVDLGLLPPDPMALSFGALVRAEGGHVLHFVPGPPDPAFSHFGVPKEFVPHIERNLNPAQQDLVKRHGYSVGTVFPNLSFMQVIVQGDFESPPTPFLSFRLWQPLSATKTRISSYLLIEKEASSAYREASSSAYVRTFGPSGIFEQDDMENWKDCTRVNKGKIAQRHFLHHGMNMQAPRDESFPGPGEAWPGSYGERTQLAFYGEWQRWLTEAAPWTR